MSGKRIMLIFAFIVLLVSCPVLPGIFLNEADPANNPYKIIGSQEDLNDVINQIKPILLTNFGISFRLPISGFLVSGRKLDELYGGAYRGAEVGLYKFRNGRHEIYIMKDMSFDNCMGTTAHELTHAWQTENCPVEQDKVLKEGFAQWIEYKVYQKTGAYVYARSLQEHADPVYGVGFKRMLDWEDKWGEFGLIQHIRNIRTLNGN